MIGNLDPAALTALGPAIVGVSGGRDSVALLHLLTIAGARNLLVAHLDHGLRPESAGDARFVRAFAASLDTTCVIEREEVSTLAKSSGVSVEAASRLARHRFFARVARKRGLTRVLLAHHADDRVETFLFNLLRGAGPGGLRAMRPVTQHLIGGITLQIHRPLLGIWREEIDAYLAGHRLIFREDPSNRDPRHTRNRIRHEILPLLRAVMGREVRAPIWRAAEIFSAEDAFLAGLIAAETEAPELALSAVRHLPLALQRRVIRAWLQANGVPEIAFGDVENVRSLVDGGPAKVNLASAAHARRRAGRLFLEWPPGTNDPRTGGRMDLYD